MEEKLKIIDGYIKQADEILAACDRGKAERLVTMIIGVYRNEIKSITQGLDSYSMSGTSDYLGDVEILKNKLINHRANISSGYYEMMNGQGSVINMSQNTKVESNIKIYVTLSQVVEEIEKIPEDTLSADEKAILEGKLSQLQVLLDKKANKKAVWDKATGILKWVGDKAVDVGIATLPYIISALQKASAVL